MPTRPPYPGKRVLSPLKRPQGQTVTWYELRADHPTPNSPSVNTLLNRKRWTPNGATKILDKSYFPFMSGIGSEKVATGHASHFNLLTVLMIT